MNAGAAEVNGTTLLSAGEDRRALSPPHRGPVHDGFSNWVVDPEPLLAPTPGMSAEAWDWRIRD